MNECLRCGYEWKPRCEERVKQCPQCKSPSWDKPKASAKEAEQAHADVAREIRSGRLAPQPCEVCGEKAIAHHDDYSKPLEVKWLCHKHHRERHVNVCGVLMQAGINLRHISAELHQKLNVRAATEKVTLESLCVRFLWQGLDQPGGPDGISEVADNDPKGATGRKGKRAPVPVLQKAKGDKKRLHPVQPVRGELEQGGRHQQGPSHDGHQTYPAGDQQWCSTCQLYFEV